MKSRFRVFDEGRHCDRGLKMNEVRVTVVLAAIASVADAPGSSAEMQMHM